MRGGFSLNFELMSLGFKPTKAFSSSHTQANHLPIISFTLGFKPTKAFSSSHAQANHLPIISLTFARECKNSTAV